MSVLDFHLKVDLITGELISTVVLYTVFENVYLTFITSSNKFQQFLKYSIRSTLFRKAIGLGIF